MILNNYGYATDINCDWVSSVSELAETAVDCAGGFPHLTGAW